MQSIQVIDETHMSNERLVHDQQHITYPSLEGGSNLCPCNLDMLTSHLGHSDLKRKGVSVKKFWVKVFHSCDSFSFGSKQVEERFPKFSANVSRVNMMSWGWKSKRKAASQRYI